MLNNSRTRAVKEKAQENYTAVDREVKRSIKKEKRDYVDYLARQTETAATTTSQGREHGGHNDSDKWEGCRAGRDTSRNHQSRHRDSWEKEEAPTQWKEGIIQLPKREDLWDCSNYRRIMLFSTPGKLLNRVLLERMKEAVDPKL